MKALTIIQPYAELIACGQKRVENRTWYTGYRGLLAIHAGKSLRYDGDSVFEIAGWYDLPRDRITLGAVIAVADLIDCVQLIERSHLNVELGGSRFGVPDAAQQRHPWLAAHEHVSGPKCFVLANVRRLTRPIFVNGQQGFFDVDDAAIKAAGLEPAGVLA